MSRDKLIIRLKDIMEEVTDIDPDTYLLLCKTVRLAQNYEWISNEIIINLANIYLPENFKIEDDNK